MTSTATPIYFEPFDIGCRADLFETYEGLHAESPHRALIESLRASLPADIGVRRLLGADP